MIRQRLERLREQMRRRGIAIYLIPTSDYHNSEYVGEFFKARKFMTGFTGSAGTAVVTLNAAGLWTDARYFLQAEMQLAGSGVTLYRMGEENVPTIREFLEKELPEGGVIGFDGRVVSGKAGEEYLRIARKKNGSLYVKEDLAGLIWEDRPPMSCAPIRVLEEQYTGKSAQEKLLALRGVMREKGADVHLMASLYDIAWLLNVRGGDISYVPVVLSYLALTQTECVWFVQEAALTQALREYLAQIGVTAQPYESFYEYCAALDAKKTVLLDTSVVNYRICSSLPQSIPVLDEPDPTVLMKSVKNPVETANTRQAHIKDAVAVCRFMYWLKTNIGKIPMTEISASDYLESLRRQQDGFLDLSFDTICGYAAHGAIIHYAATAQTDVPLKAEGLLLVDSGGHYLEGTTDITRTFALGPVSAEMKRDFTMVCRSMLHLMSAKFLYGCSGQNLDVLARGPFWERGLDYKHGTGHGVGHILNVHEGPNGFRWKVSADRSESARLEEGMITTDEPGIYLEGKYGVRLENELLCRRAEKNEYGQFMRFDTLTLVPIDLDALEPSAMNENERACLNAYHQTVYETIAPHLNAQEAAFLKEYTRAI